MGEPICPDCGDSFSKIGVHWNQSGSCSYPEPSAGQRELLTGLLMAGARISDVYVSDYRTARLQLTSTNESLLRWVREQFPVLATDVTVKATADEQRESLATQHGLDPDEVDSSTLYKFRTRKLPTLARIRHDWYGQDESGAATPPSCIEATPLILKVVYAFSGRLDPHQGPQPGASFQMGAVRGDADFWERYLGRFEATARRQSETPLVFVRDSAAFFEYLTRDSFTQDDSIPGTEPKWPDDFSNLATLGPEAERCPCCGQLFNNLGSHWGFENCTPPHLPEAWLDFLAGMLAVGGTCIPAETTRYPLLRFASRDESFFDWLDDYLEVFGKGYVESDESEREFTEGDSTEIVTFEKRYLYHTRPHPAFERFTEWREGGSRTVPDSVDPTPTLLRGMYALKGAVDEDDNPYIDIARQPLTESRATDWLSDFDPHVESSPGVQRVYLGDEEAFCGYVSGRNGFPSSDSRKWDVLRE